MSDKLVDLEIIERLLQNAKLDIDQFLYENAIIKVKQALEMLGTSYRAPGLKDSTQMKIRAAEEMINERDFKTAANLLYKMLEVRIQLYKEKFSIQ